MLSRHVCTVHCEHTIHFHRVGRDFYLTLDLINFLVQALALVHLEM